jgi:hypothetical protein
MEKQTQLQLTEEKVTLQDVVDALNANHKGMKPWKAKPQDVKKFDDNCNRDGYLSKALQIQRYKDAGEQYDKWLAENFYNGEPRRPDGSPTPTEDAYDPCLRHDYTEMDAMDEMRNIPSITPQDNPNPVPSPAPVDPPKTDNPPKEEK